MLLCFNTHIYLPSLYYQLYIQIPVQLDSTSEVQSRSGELAGLYYSKDRYSADAMKSQGKDSNGLIPCKSYNNGIYILIHCINRKIYSIMMTLNVDSSRRISSIRSLSILPINLSHSTNLSLTLTLSSTSSEGWCSCWCWWCWCWWW